MSRLVSRDVCNALRIWKCSATRGKDLEAFGYDLAAMGRPVLAAMLVVFAAGCGGGGSTSGGGTQPTTAASPPAHPKTQPAPVPAIPTGLPKPDFKATLTGSGHQALVGHPW